MLDTSARTELVLARTRQLRRRRARGVQAGLILSCFLSAAGLTLLYRSLPGLSGPSHLSGFYASMLLYSDAGGYILDGLLAFTAGVVLTVICIRMRKKAKPPGGISPNSTSEKEEEIKL